VAQGRDDLRGRKVLVGEDDVQLVEQEELQAGMGEVSQDQLPAGPRARRVFLPALRVPGESLADFVPAQERRLEQRLGGAAATLDELDDRAFETVPERAQQHPQRGAGLSLAVAGVDDDQAFSSASARDLS